MRSLMLVFAFAGMVAGGQQTTPANSDAHSSIVKLIPNECAKVQPGDTIQLRVEVHSDLDLPITNSAVFTHEEKTFSVALTAVEAERVKERPENKVYTLSGPAPKYVSGGEYHLTQLSIVSMLRNFQDYGQLSPFQALPLTNQASADLKQLSVCIDRDSPRPPLPKGEVVDVK